MAKRLFGVEICLVSLLDANRQWFKSKQGLEVCETDRAISFCGHVIVDENIMFIPDASKDPRFHDNPLVTGPPHIRFYAGCPVHSPEGYRIGTLCLIDSQPRDFSEDDKHILTDMAGLIDDELRLSAQVTVDELTQIANRRGFNCVAQHVLGVSKRVNAESELLLFDLDGFKAINDDLGHTAGDLVLQHFAALLVKHFRSADVVARIGGDEFAVLTTGSGCSSDSALARLRSAAAEEVCPIKCQLDWSVGRTVYDPDLHTTPDMLLADADEQMYAHKTARRKIE